MVNRSGTADLPLHHGKVPPWLANRMAQLSRPIVEAIILEFGKEELLKRLSDPLWFQSFGAVLGMDWHSSGITTSVVGALKRAINPISHEIGVYICGGRGKHSRKTPQELMQVADQTGLDGHYLVRSSRLSAKVDNTAIQDGFQIYLHSFIVTREGDWTVIQQGLNGESGYARRYHWHSKAFESFVNDPHTSIFGKQQGLILNLTDTKADSTRNKLVEFCQIHPEKALNEVRKIHMPQHHDVKAKDVNLKRLGSIIALAHEKDPQDFEELLLLNGMGPRTLQSLTLVSEVIYGTPSRFEDPARYSFAHGGKDGHPFPVPTKVYDNTINTLKSAVEKAKIGDKDKQQAIKKLHHMALNIEQNFLPNDNYDALIEKEWEMSNQWGGRTTFDSKSKQAALNKRKVINRQLRLF